MKGLNLGLNPEVSESLDTSTVMILFSAAALLALMGLLLLITRVRYLGLVWRAIAVVGISLPVFYAVAWWQFVSDPTARLLGKDPNVGEKIVSGALTLASDLGLYKVSAGQGLVLITAGCIVGVLAVLIPALRRTDVVPVANFASRPHSPSSAPAVGWYPDPANPGLVWHWDGRGWTGPQPRA